MQHQCSSRRLLVAARVAIYFLVVALPVIFEGISRPARPGIPRPGLTQDARATVALSPNSAARGSTISVTVTGDLTTFLQNATVADFGPGITIAGASGPRPIQVSGSTSASVQIRIGTDAAPGPRVIRITTGSHSSAATFFVQPSASDPATLPVADAGPEQQVVLGSVVHLDACGSYLRSTTPGTDAAMTYKWSFLSIPPGSTAELSDDADPMPTFIADIQGDYLVKLSATNGTQTTVSAVTISATNTAPRARAAVKGIVALGTMAKLDASASTAADSDTLTYHWDLLSKPTSSSAALVNSSAVTAILPVDVAGKYLAQVTVNDGHGNNSTDVVTVSTDNVSPVADAGDDQTVTVGAAVLLDGSGSLDPDGDPLIYAWSFNQKPEGSSATLSDRTSSRPTFTADLPGMYALQLAVSDGHGNVSAPATVTIATGNMPPTAAAGASRNVSIGTTVVLDGSGSRDTQGHALTYSWVFLSKPDGSNATLANATSAHPSFVPDKPGFYVAQLIVSSGTFTSTPSAVLFTTITPDLSTDQTAIAFASQHTGTSSPSETVEITSTGITDLTITGFSLSGPNAAEFAFASAALPITLSPGSSTTVSVTFNPLTVGTKAAALSISANAVSGTHQVNLSGTAVSPVFAADSTSVAFGEQSLNKSGTATLTISNKGDADLVLSSIAMSGPNAAQFTVTPKTTPITIAPDATQVLNLAFTPTSVGAQTAVLTIDHNGPNHPATINLTGSGIAPVLELSPTSLAFSAQQVNITSQPQIVSLKNSGVGTMVVSAVSFTGSNPEDFAVTSTLPIRVAQNATAPLNVTFTPLGSGPRSATLNLTDNADGGSHTVGLSGSGVASGDLKLMPLSVGQNLQGSATVGINVASTQNLSVLIRSADKTKVLLSATPTGATSDSVTVSIPAGNLYSLSGFFVHALSGSGTAQLTATAPGYSASTAAITLSPSALLLSGPAGLGAAFTTDPGSDKQLRVFAYRLNSDLTIAAEQKVRSGLSASVVVSSGSTTVGTVNGSPANIAPGNSHVDTLTFHPVGAGTTLLSVAQPAGFSQPASGASLNATVAAPAITLQPLLVGANLEVRGLGALNVAPKTDTHVTIQSSNANMILLSSDPTKGGSASLDVVVPTGQTTLPPFYVQAVASSGTAQLIASCTAYKSGNANVMITPSAILISGPDGGNGADFSTTTISANSLLTLSAYRLDPVNNIASDGTIRGGLQLSITVVSGTPSVGTIVHSPATMRGGEAKNTAIFFDPLVAGTTQIRVQQPSGFSIPASGGSLNATVTPPKISLSFGNTSIGKDLQVKGIGGLNVAAPSTGLTVTVTSDNPDVLLSANETIVGSQSITLTVPPGKGYQGVGFPPFFVQAINDSGSATITAAATSWTSVTGTVTLTPAGFVLRSINGIGADFGTLLSQGNKNVSVLSVQLDPTTLEMQSVESVRGLITPLPVYLTSGTPGVGTVPDHLLFSGGMTQQDFIFHPVSPGTTVLTVNTPTGFATPSIGAQLNAVVN